MAFHQGEQRDVPDTSPAFSLTLCVVSGSNVSFLPLCNLLLHPFAVTQVTFCCSARAFSLPSSLPVSLSLVFFFLLIYSSALFCVALFKTKFAEFA